MGEPNRRDDQLTTADIANRAANREDDRSTTPREEAERRRPEKPKLVRHETSAELPDTTNIASTTTRPGTTNAPDTNTTVAGRQDASGATPLFSESERGDLQSRWSNIQADFVDEPRRAVEQADQLVATAMQKLADGFANERASLEKQWDSGENVSTEDLRIALQRYRVFFGRLLNAA